MKFTIREMLALVAGVTIGLALALVLHNSMSGLESGLNNTQNVTIADLKIRVSELEARIK